MSSYMIRKKEVFAMSVVWFSVIALGFGLVLAFTGWKLVRKSFSGLMDAEDLEMIQKLGKLFYKHAFM